MWNHFLAGAAGFLIVEGALTPDLAGEALAGEALVGVGFFY